MHTKKTDSIEERLGSWKVSIQEDPELASHVLNRIATEQASSIPSRIPPVARWGLGLAVAATLMAGIFFGSQQLERNRMLREGSYVLLIDPVIRVEMGAVDGIPSSGDSLVERLAWMQDRLDLSREQFLSLVELHKSYSDRFDRLYDELVQLNGQFAEFEGLRQQNEMIDFIALYDVLKERQATESDSFALSREFVSRVTALLRTDQRAAYLSLVEASTNHPDA